MSGWVGPTDESPGGGKDAPPPVARKKRWVASPPGGFGSFHQQYRIDDKLVAVGVVGDTACRPNTSSGTRLRRLSPEARRSAGDRVGQEASALSHPAVLLHGLLHRLPNAVQGEYKPSELRCAATGVWSDLDSACVRVLDAGLGFAPFVPGAVARRTWMLTWALTWAPRGRRRSGTARRRRGCHPGSRRATAGSRASANDFGGRRAAPAGDEGQAEGEVGAVGGRLGTRGVRGVPPVSGPARGQRRMSARRIRQSDEEGREPAGKTTGSSSATPRPLARISPCGCDETHARALTYGYELER